MFLTIEERLKFMEYCEQQAKDCDAISGQIHKVVPHPMAEQLVNQHKLRAKAYTLVAADLAATTENVSVKSIDVGVVTFDEPV